MLILKGYNDKAGKTTKSNKIWFLNGFLCAFLIILMSCTHFAAKQQVLDKQVSQIKQEQVERAAVYVKGASETLHTIATQDRTPETDLAEQLVNLGSDLLPTVPVYLRLDISALLSENQKTRELAEKSLNKMILQDKETAQKLDNVEKQLGKVEERLIKLGEIKEKENNSSIVKRVWGWGIATFGIGGLIALCIFFPFLIPIFMSILSYIANAIVTIFPSLIRFVGGVSKGVWERTVTGIENAKNKVKNAPPDKTFTKQEVEDLLKTELSKSQDSRDKNLVDYTKTKLELTAVK